jgi:peptide/nickel transport system permease protein
MFAPRAAQRAGAGAGAGHHPGGAAIITEATLSFLGVGVPPTQPSLGTLIRVGNDFLFSGEWWITIFPGLMLVLIALSVNLLGDWLRDALNPRLR